MISSSSPSQTLLSTIYKQSWHPLTSTKYSSCNGPGNANSQNGVGNTHYHQRNSPIQRPSPVPEGSKKRCKSPSQKGSKKHSATPSGYVLKNGRLTVCETSYRKTFAKKEEDLQTINHRYVPEPVLRTWRRRLKTCLESNFRDSSVKSGSVATNKTSKRTGSIPSSQTLARRHSNDSAPKPYKILNYQNATLASICVQGKDPPVKPPLVRADISPRRRTQSSCVPSSSSSSSFPPVECHGNEQSPSEDHSSSTSVEDSTSPRISTLCFENGNESSFCSHAHSFTDIANCVTTDDVTNDDVFAFQNVCAETTESFKEEDTVDFKHTFATGDENIDCLDVTPDLEMINLDYENEEDSSSLDDCDLSDQETSSDDDDDDANDPGSDEEESRLVLEKYKHLYEHENMSESRSVCEYKLDAFEEEATWKGCLAEDYESDEGLSEPLKYEFASVFPKQFDKYNLHELSTLPLDVNWRTLVKMSDLSNSRNAWSKKHYFAKTAQARAKKSIEDKKKMETLVDRLLALEKLQTATAQREIIRKFHIQHLRASGARQKSVQSARNNSLSLVTNETKLSEGSGEVNISGPKSPSRRRSSVTALSSRRAWVNSMSEAEQTEVQEACRNGDVSVLLDNWMTKSKNTKTPGDGSRRGSEAGKLAKRARSRRSQGRCYDYSCSERGKEEKTQTKPYWNTNRTHPSCQTCREKIRKLNQNNKQEHRRRPSTDSSCPSSSRQQPTIEKNQSRLTPPSKPSRSFTSSPAVSATPNGWPPTTRSLPTTEIGQLMERNNNLMAQYSRRRQHAHVYSILAERRGGGQDALSPTLKILPAAFNSRPNLNKKVHNINIIY